MLKYLIQVTQDLFVPGIIAAMLFAYAAICSKRDRIILWAGGGIGLLSAAFIAYTRETSNKMDSEMWNIRIVCISLAAFVVFTLLVNPLAKKLTKKLSPIFTSVGCIGGAVTAAAAFSEALPPVIRYPFGFVSADESAFSTDFMFKFAGWMAAIILVFIAGLALYKGARAADNKKVAAMFWLMLFVNEVKLAAKGMSSLKIRIKTGHIKGPFAVNMQAFMRTKPIAAYTKFVSNHPEAFVYIIILIALAIPVIMWAKSFKVNEPYDNPAQHRKIRAKWRSRRRWASAVMVCSLLSVLNLTAVKAYTEKGAELSPVEDCEIRDGNVYVSLDKVGDGHLHRFAYYTDSKVEIRFIVIKKPNSQAYGVGLDACDICGKTGYYEKNDQVVCNRCDVVMNVNTIGFKGGCNPIPFDYKVEKGNIVIAVSTLAEFENKFK